MRSEPDAVAPRALVDVAIALLDADGLDALTMRKLATRLGVQAGALYWHFASKQALLDAMADRFLEGFAADRPAGSWDEQFSALGWRLRQVLLSHRDARVMAGTYVAEPNTILLGNMVIEILQAAGLPPPARLGRLYRVPLRARPHHRRTSAIELTERGAGKPKLRAGTEQARRHGLHRRSRRAVRLRPPALPRRHPPATTLLPAAAQATDQAGEGGADKEEGGECATGASAHLGFARPPHHSEEGRRIPAR